MKDLSMSLILRNMKCVGMAARDGREGVLVAGGHGKGAAFNQLNYPRQIFVDADHSVYVSDMR